MVKGLFKEIEAEAKIEIVKVVSGQKEKGKRVWIVKLENKNQKKDLMKKKALLRRRKERVMDLTWKKRKMR